MRIESLYQDRSQRAPHRARHDDIFGKMLGTLRESRRAKHRPYLLLEGERYQEPGAIERGAAAPKLG